MPTNYDAARPSGPSWRVTVGGEEIGSDIAPLFDLEQVLRVESASRPDMVIMSEQVARAFEGHPYVTGTLEVVEGSLDLMDSAPTPTLVPPPRKRKRRDTKPAPKPRKRERRSPRHTQRRR